MRPRPFEAHSAQFNCTRPSKASVSVVFGFIVHYLRSSLSNTAVFYSPISTDQRPLQCMSTGCTAIVQCVFGYELVVLQFVSCHVLSVSSPLATCEHNTSLVSISVATRHRINILSNRIVDRLEIPVIGSHRNTICISRHTCATCDTHTHTHTSLSEAQQLQNGADR